ncbi:helix-turn-helix transcriptional regulator [Anditalea andensis]|uniref:DeoR faimly transcriptional regulator n=1 Tax=Anditalea andensis TaxID=1048983 RepID=A0A074LND6_9BACT|nr:YafY family protein [Anditalea andensis]KEO75442.1 DeoR faimly transcriptional regulator [Anditalea andensis]
MINKDISRLSRLIAILTQLQTKRIITSTTLAEKFSVSVRTIYRDIKVLEQAGVPILAEEGKGYTLMAGYKMPPIMFTEDEANALITAEKLVMVNKDISLIKNYTEATAKIKSVLQNNAKDKAELLSKRVAFWENPNNKEATSNTLSLLQMALTNFNVVNIEYHSTSSAESTKRDIEPFAFINNVGASWYLIAWCRLRKDYRLFRFDRIKALEITAKTFSPHKISLEEYLAQYRKNNF